MSVKVQTVGPMGRRHVAICDRCQRPVGHHQDRGVAEAIEAEHLRRVHRIGGDDAA